MLVLSPATAICQKPNDDGSAFNTVDYGAASWKEYKPGGGKYALLLPGLPREQVEMVDTALGKTELHMSILAVTYKEDFVICAVNYSDFPVQITDPTAIRKTLDGARAELLANKTRKLISETEIYLDAHLGREIKIEQGDLAWVSRIFLVRDRLFQVAVFASKAPKSDDVAKFQEDVRQKILSSFKVFSE
ncbi:MAG TPA: hypothetical protein VNF70_05110 [Pyrinomonadaceae bacterium]|nr:hypothetical protein [Pyrinomonadaceae bacterium]